MSAPNRHRGDGDSDGHEGEDVGAGTSRHRRRPRILLGVTGSVAAVKGPKLALLLADEAGAGADVKVVLTRTVERHFWREGRAASTYDRDSWTALRAATSGSDGSEPERDGGRRRSSGGDVSIHRAEEEWAAYNGLSDPVLHIDLRNWADACVVAPLSAHTLAKFAHGSCDDLLSCVVRAWDFGQRRTAEGRFGRRGKPLILAPAMNTVMWDHPLTRAQLEAVRGFSQGAKAEDEAASRGGGEAKGGTDVVVVVEPAVKKLACGEVGAGALADLDVIVDEVKKCLGRSGWGANERVSNAVDDDAGGVDADLSSRKEAMRKSLLRFAKQSFRELKSSHEQRSASASVTSRLVAPISPTPNSIVEAFLPRLELRRDSFLVDLGCGDGRWLLAAHGLARCRCLGVDVDEGRLDAARESIAEAGAQELVEVRGQDVFEFARESEDIGNADAIVLYLFREAMTEMGTLLRRRLLSWDEGTSIPRKRVRLLSVGFALVGWTPVCEEKVNEIRVYLYDTDALS
ncbi:hypothetical protein ACHAWF_004934 [Thalassiosira exigua]